MRGKLEDGSPSWEQTNVMEEHTRFFDSMLLMKKRKRNSNMCNSIRHNSNNILKVSMKYYLNLALLNRKGRRKHFLQYN